MAKSDPLPLLLTAAAAGGAAAYYGLLGTQLQTQIRGLLHQGAHLAGGGTCPGPNDGELVLAPENAPGTTIRPLYLWAGGQLRHITTEAVTSALGKRATRTDIPQRCIDALPKGNPLSDPSQIPAAAPATPTRNVADPAVQKWIERIAGDVADTYRVNLDRVDRAEDVPGNFFVDGASSGARLRIYFTAGGKKFVADVPRDVDPKRRAEGTNTGNYGYRYYYTTGIQQLF